MSNEKGISRQAIKQFIETDRLFGLEEVPIASAALEKSMSARPSPPTTGADVGAEDKTERLRVLDDKQVKGCTRCRLHEGRNNTVFGVGSATAQLVFVGEGPGFEEDRQGIPFVGRAGQLLTRMIAAMGLTREEVYICNVVKCRPPNNRDPAADEIAACSPFLFEQLDVIDPQVIVALGAPAAKTLLQTKQSIGALRGRFHEFQLPGLTGEKRMIPLMPTYHPAYLLRSPDQKIKAWDDLKMVMAKMGLTSPR